MQLTKLHQTQFVKTEER